MTHAFALIVLMSILGLPIDASTLDGQRLSGELQSLNGTEAVLTADGESRTIPLSELSELQFSKTAATDSLPLSTQRVLQLRDGSVLTPTTLTAAKQQFSVTSDALGEWSVPKSSVASVRLASLDSKIAQAWESLLERKTRDDLVVIRKGDALDHVTGVVSTIDNESISLLLDGNAVELPRSRVFGVIYAAPQSSTVSSVCILELVDGQRLALSEIRLDGDAFAIKSTAGPSLSIPVSDVRRIDFSLGKIEQLAEMEPTSVQYPVDHPLYLEEVWKYRIGRNSRGEPLQLAGKHYDNGLWIHSGTVLRFRLGRQYRRLQSLIGIDEDLGDCAPQVGLIIRGDGRVLHEVDVARSDEVRRLDLDVAGVRELEIEVVSSDPNGICEHLDLVEARLIK